MLFLVTKTLFAGREGYALLALAMVVLALPTAVFLANSRSLSWDLVGHVAEAKAYSEVLPNIYGWNSSYLLGYPIYIYPPLSRLATALISNFIEISLAARLILSLSCLLILPSAFLFIRSQGHSAGQAGAASLLLALFMATTVQTTSVARGFTLYEAYYFGMFSEFFALPFFFLALAYFRSRPKISALFSCLVLLSNFLVSVMLLLSILALLLAEKRKGPPVIRLPSAAVYASVVFLLSAFWLIPYISQTVSSPPSRSDYFAEPQVLIGAPAVGGALISGLLIYFLFIRNAPHGHTHSKGVIVLCLIAIGIFLPATAPGCTYWDFKLPVLAGSAMASAYLLGRKQDNLVCAYLWFVFLFLSMHAVLALMFPGQPIATLLLHHSYRFLAFAEVIQVLILGAGAWDLLLEKLGEKSRLALPALFSAAVLLAALFFPAYWFRLYIHPEESGNLYDFSSAHPQGRALVFSSTDCATGLYRCRPHSANFQFSMQTGKPLSYGLFLEEAPLSEASVDLTYLIKRTPTLMWSLTRPYNVTMFGNYTNAARFYSDLLWLTDFYFSEGTFGNASNNTARLQAAFEKQGQLNASAAIFDHYLLSNSSVVETRHIVPACTRDWGRFVRSWFQAASQTIYYDSCQEQADTSGKASNNGPEGKVEEIYYGNGKISFFVDSTSPRMVLVKEAYHPGWKAHQGGTELQVFRATPGIMAVYAQGRVEMEFDQGIGPVSLLLSALGLVILVMVPSKHLLPSLNSNI